MTHRSSEPGWGFESLRAYSGTTADLRDATAEQATGCVRKSRPAKALGPTTELESAAFLLPLQCKSMQSVTLRGELDGTNTGTVGTYTGTV